MHIFQSKPQFEAYLDKLGTAFGGVNVREDFTVTVPQAQQLINAIQESDEFLKRVSIIQVTDTKGEIVTLSLSRPLASRTNTATAGAERQAKTITDKAGRAYEVGQINFDYALRYAEIDQWARYRDYESRVAAMVNRRIALDKLYIGWYGESRADDTNATNNPLLQDVSVGWFKRLKDGNPDNFVTKSGTGATIVIGDAAGADYKNLDQAANDLLSLIPKMYRTGREVVLVGNSLLAWEADILFGLYGQKPTEKQALQVLNKGIAGMPAVTPAGFPDYGLMVVDPANLQIYMQSNSMRKQICDAPKRDQVETYNSMNLDWQIGELKACACLDHKQLEAGMTAEPAADSGTGTTSGDTSGTGETSGTTENTGA